MDVITAQSHRMAFNSVTKDDSTALLQANQMLLRREPGNSGNINLSTLTNKVDKVAMMIAFLPIDEQ